MARMTYLGLCNPQCLMAFFMSIGDVDRATDWVMGCTHTTALWLVSPLLLGVPLGVYPWPITTRPMIVRKIMVGWGHLAAWHQDIKKKQMGHRRQV